MIGNKKGAEDLPTGRKIELTLGSILLSIFLVATILVFSLTQITTPDNLKPIIAGVSVQSFMKNMTPDQISGVYSQLASSCESTGSDTVLLPVGQQAQAVPISCAKVKSSTAADVNSLFPVPVALSEDDKAFVYNNLSAECNRTGIDVVYYVIKTDDTTLDNLTVSCSEVKATKPQDAGKLFGSAIFDKLYYADPGCNYPECFFKEKSGPEYFIIFLSSKAHDFYTILFYVLIVLTIVTAAVVIALGRAWYTVAKDFGISLVIAGIPVFGIGFIKSGMPKELVDLVGSTADTLFQNLTNNFLIVFVIGLILLIIGIIGNRYSNKTG